MLNYQRVSHVCQTRIIARDYFLFNRNGMMILTFDKGTAPMGSSKSQPPKAATQVAKKKE